MSARVSEAFILRTWPFQEADLIVSFLTRDQGKLRGVAKRARRPKGPFGSSLERLTEVRVSYFQKETVELVRLEGCELIQTQFGLAGSYAASVVLDYIAEVSEQLLPPSEPSERFFRLIGAVLADLRRAPEAAAYRAATYFTFWAVRLSGFLPDLVVSRESQLLAHELATQPIQALANEPWPRERALDLRRFLVKEIEYHVERKLITAPVLESL